MKSLSPLQFSDWLQMLPAMQGCSAATTLLSVEADGALPEPAAQRAADSAIVVVVDREGCLPGGYTLAADVMLTTANDAPAPWVFVETEKLVRSLALLDTNAQQSPRASATLCQVLRASEGMRFESALVMESFAYSMLLASSEFRAWRQTSPVRPRDEKNGLVRLDRDGDVLAVTLARPERRNALCASMRSELAEAFRTVAVDDTVRSLVLRGEGESFCSGGDLDEFGTATDAVLAHMVRLEQSACMQLACIGSRVQVELHGACIGAGIEIPAAAGHVRAQRGTWFRLPEVAMGLIPGAGGTASIPRRIGRHRTCWMALSGIEVDARTALAWHLIDALASA